HRPHVRSTQSSKSSGGTLSMTRRLSKALAAVFLLLLVPNTKTAVLAQTKTLAERLDYPPDAKLLIVHADDLGMAHSINAASTKAFATGLVNSGSIMVPCPWLLEIATYARSNPQADLGLHLTLTSEWKNFRWGPVLPKDKVATLLDETGYLYLTEREAASRASVAEVESEIRAQIERARKLGIQPTHLDSHMGTLYQSKELFEMFLRVARENKLPVRLSKDMFGQLSFLPSIMQPTDVAIDQIVTIDQNVMGAGWAKYYSDAL